MWDLSTFHTKQLLTLIEHLFQKSDLLTQENESLRKALNSAMGFAKHAVPKGDKTFSELVNKIKAIRSDQ